MKDVPYRSIQVAKSFLFILLPMALFANPAGEKIVFGNAAVERPSADVLNVVQASPQAIIEWKNPDVEKAYEQGLAAPRPATES